MKEPELIEGHVTVEGSVSVDNSVVIDAEQWDDLMHLLRQIRSLLEAIADNTS